MMFTKLFAEIDTIRDAFPEYGFLEALSFIAAHVTEFDSDVRAELAVFMGLGAEFFAEVE
jgi:hypothetical protein